MAASLPIMNSLVQLEEIKEGMIAYLNDGPGMPISNAELLKCCSPWNNDPMPTNLLEELALG